MSVQDKIIDHYRHGELLSAISSGVEKLGKTSKNVTVDDLAPVDEFHIGGRKASADFLNQLQLSPDKHILDIGCGIGGTSRFVADRYKCTVSGIDLSDEYIRTGEKLSAWLGLEKIIHLQQGSAVQTGFENNSFDAAYMLHVGMNIKDKSALFEEAFRVLRPSSLFGVYDVMKMDEGEILFPVPWAENAITSSVASLDEYKLALEKAGFVIEAERNRKDFAIEFFEKLKVKSASAKNRPALGLHILMGETAEIKVQNMVKNIASGKIAPVELIARKPG
jgi:ubiquinone/menaquinone biosynthesis C-methylase UbiE